MISKMRIKPDVICISESRLIDKKIKWQLGLVKLPDYNLKYDNSKTSAGGVAIYVNTAINDFKIKSELKLKDEDCESLFLEIYFDKNMKSEKITKKETILLGCIYRHPRWVTSAFIKQLFEKLHIFLEKNTPILVLGDINIDVLEKCERSQNYINVLSSIGCKNIVKVPTCFSDKSRSCLDHVITNIDQNEIIHGVLDDTPTDHVPIYAIFRGNNKSYKIKNEEKEQSKWRFFDEKKKDTFLNTLEGKLSDIDLSQHPDNILVALTDATQAAIDICFPLKTKSNRAKKRSLTPWYDTEIFEGEKKQRRLFRRFIRTKSEYDHQIYKTFRKALSKRKYNAKKLYFQDLLNEAKNSEDRRATWNVINKTFGKKKKERIFPDKVKIGDTSNPSTSKCPKDIAEVLNVHFTNVAKNLAKKLGKTDLKYSDFMGTENKSSMFITPIELHEILDQIRKICLRKAMGYDEIPPKIIKWASDILAPILLVLFNKCIDLGHYPEGMKIGQVVPVYKEGEKNGINNYRPITVLSQFNQLFEHLLTKRYLNFFEKFDVITKRQFGFLKKHCTEHAILDLKEYIMKNLENKEATAVLFLDLQKAFDTVNHDILLQKLYHYGVRGNAFLLLKSYLSGRKQRTKVKNAVSNLAFVLWGVPQGSVLGPLLFLIFINDLPNTSDLYSWLFADDTALALSSNNIQELQIRFNHEVNKVHDWLLANRLSVHYKDKTKFMIIQGPNTKDRRTKSMNFKLHMGNHEIEKTDHYKYLGLLLDDKLNWKLQTNKLCSKLSSVCGVLSKVRHYLDRKSLMLIYNSLFDSRLRYGILGWGTTCEQNLSKLRVLQNRAVRFITFASFRSPVAPIYASLKILPLNEILFLQKSIFMHSLHYKYLPFVFGDYCQQPAHRYSTRYTTSRNYIIPHSVTNRGQGSIKYTGPKAWAEVPNKFKDIAFRKPFSKKFKDHILNMIHVELPPKPTRKIENKEMECLDLNILFSNDEEGEFFGFENPVVKNYNSRDDLNVIFATDNIEEEFYGFDVSNNLELLFLTDDSAEEEFLGF